jgi:hypothetical protein
LQGCEDSRRHMHRMVVRVRGATYHFLTNGSWRGEKGRYRHPAGSVSIRATRHAACTTG